MEIKCVLHISERLCSDKIMTSYLKIGKGILKGNSGTGDVAQWIRTLAVKERKSEFKFLAPILKKNKPSMAACECNSIVEWEQVDHWNVMASQLSLNGGLQVQ